MKRISLLIVVCLLLSGCSARDEALGTTGGDVEASTASVVTTTPSTVPVPLTTLTSTTSVVDEVVAETTTTTFPPPEPPVRLLIRSLEIDGPVDVVETSDDHPCNRAIGNACEDRIDLVVLYSSSLPCTIGVSVFSAHVNEHFKRLLEVQVDTVVSMELADGSVCIGTVLNWDEGPGEKIDGTVARWWDKQVIGEIEPELHALGENKSLGVLTTSYCGACRSVDLYVTPDGVTHRRYNSAVLVEWLGVYVPEPIVLP